MSTFLAAVIVDEQKQKQEQNTATRSTPTATTDTTSTAAECQQDAEADAAAWQDIKEQEEEEYFEEECFDAGDKYDNEGDFAVGTGARGGGKGRSTKTECRGNKNRTIYNAKHVRKMVAVLTL